MRVLAIFTDVLLVLTTAFCLIVATSSPLRADGVVLGSPDMAPALRRSPEGNRPAGPSPSETAPDPEAFRDHQGYRGPHFRSDINGFKVIVLSQTLFQWPTPGWKVSGLIRNETGSDIKVIAVTARLFDSSRNGLGAAAAWLPLDRLRPGEPAPFVVTTAIPENTVSSIDWSVEYVPSDPQNRAFQIVPYWTQPFGDRRRHTGYPLADPTNPPYPYVVFGSIRNTSSTTVDAARLLGAWLDMQGRVVYVDWLSFISANDLARRQRSITLAPGQAEDYIYQSGYTTVGTQLSPAALALWGVSQ